jgi:hypothetical protein
MRDGATGKSTFVYFIALKLHALTSLHPEFFVNEQLPRYLILIYLLSTFTSTSSSDVSLPDELRFGFLKESSLNMYLFDTAGLDGCAHLMD